MNYDTESSNIKHIYKVFWPFSQNVFNTIKHVDRDYSLKNECLSIGDKYLGLIPDQVLTETLKSKVWILSWATGQTKISRKSSPDQDEHLFMASN